MAEWKTHWSQEPAINNHKSSTLFVRTNARVAKLEDARVLRTRDCKIVRVQFPSLAPLLTIRPIGEIEDTRVLGTRTERCESSTLSSGINTAR